MDRDFTGVVGLIAISLGSLGVWVFIVASFITNLDNRVKKLEAADDARKDEGAE